MLFLYLLKTKHNETNNERLTKIMYFMTLKIIFEKHLYVQLHTEINIIYALELIVDF